MHLIKKISLSLLLLSHFMATHASYEDYVESVNRTNEQRRQKTQAMINSATSSKERCEIALECDNRCQNYKDVKALSKEMWEFECQQKAKEREIKEQEKFIRFHGGWSYSDLFDTYENYCDKWNKLKKADELYLKNCTHHTTNDSSGSHYSSECMMCSLKNNPNPCITPPLLTKEAWDAEKLKEKGKLLQEEKQKNLKEENQKKQTRMENIACLKTSLSVISFIMVGCVGIYHFTSPKTGPILPTQPDNAPDLAWLCDQIVGQPCQICHKKESRVQCKQRTTIENQLAKECSQKDALLHGIPSGRYGCCPWETEIDCRMRNNAIKIRNKMTSQNPSEKIMAYRELKYQHLLPIVLKNHSHKSNDPKHKHR